MNAPGTPGVPKKACDSSTYRFRILLLVIKACPLTWTRVQFVSIQGGVN
jgi:hypothetical protein